MILLSLAAMSMDLTTKYKTLIFKITFGLDTNLCIALIIVGSRDSPLGVGGLAEKKNRVFLSF